jgi:hypothetical protein
VAAPLAASTPNGVRPRAPAGARLVILALHVFRQGEEGLGVVDRRLDHDFVQAMVRDDGEAIALERLAQCVGEGLEVLIVQFHRHRRQGAGLSGGGGFGSRLEPLSTV